MMKNLLAIIMAMMLMLVPTLCLAEEAPDAGQISVQGCASVRVTPDLANVTLGVEITDDDASTAQGRVNEIVDAAIQAIKALGVEDSAIQTSSMSIYREYDYSGDSPKVVGFTASTRLTTALSDIELAGAVIDAGLGAGANTLSSISFASSRQAECYDQALAAAMTNALHKAEILAQAAGGSIAGIASVSEEYSSGMYVARGESFDTANVQLTSENSTEISAGEIEISANITAVFNLG